MLRIPSRLSDELEALVSRTIACCINVHRELGAGLLEQIYCRAVQLELRADGVRFQREKAVPITYRGTRVGKHYLDLVVEDQLVLELKSVEAIAAVHRAQVLSYLRASGLRVALLINFNVPVLPDGIKRFVL